MVLCIVLVEYQIRVNFISTKRRRVLLTLRKDYSSHLDTNQQLFRQTAAIALSNKMGNNFLYYISFVFTKTL